MPRGRRPFSAVSLGAGQVRAGVFTMTDSERGIDQVDRHCSGSRDLETPLPVQRAPVRWVLCGLIAMLALPVAAGVLWVLDSSGAEAQLEPQTQRAGLRDAGFDLGDKLKIPKAEILSGGPGKDGIPSLTEPAIVEAVAADGLEPADRVAGVFIGGQARAYPLRILVWHEIVNDTLGGEPIAVTYCPLCDSVAAFDRRTPGGIKEFGVSGLLYNSNVLMFDRGGKPEGLWSQLKAQAVSGPQAGQTLRTLSVELTTWADWRARHPETNVLSMKTGIPRDYATNPYAGYFDRPGLLFPARPKSDRLPEKEKVLGVWAADGTAKAYPISAFADRREPVQFRDRIGGRSLTLRYEPESRSLRVVEADKGLEWMYSFWFAWYAFHSQTEVHDRPAK